METVGLTFFILILLCGLFLTLLGWPGTVLIFLAALVYGLATGCAQIGWKDILILLFLTVLAESLEFLLGMLGAMRFGASANILWPTLLGSALGAMALAPFLYGLGILIGTFLGGFLAVFLVELIRRQKLKAAFRASLGSLWGRFLGMMAKSGCAVAMTALILIKIYD
jgi:uncharacterized protein YqgC (DUF456 family)